jgi:uncharacterized membrane protein
MQNPPPSQGSYGAPAAAPVPPQGKTSTGLEPNIAAAISYIWVVGLIFFFLEKDNRFVRFHAMQSILYGVCWSVIMITLIFVGMIFTFVGAAIAGTAGNSVGSLFGIFISLVWLLVWIVPIGLFVGLILSAVKAYQGLVFKLPIIGNMAEKIVNK